MSLILNIDTAMPNAYLSIAKNGKVLFEISNTNQRDHGQFLQPGIQLLLKETAVSIHELDAIAISAGPGSYTGLRIGMSSAKGLCYALGKPLITISTLEILAFSAILQNDKEIFNSSTLFCPMIDARRMEVFSALYNAQLEIVSDPATIIIDENFCAKQLLNNNIQFFGTGAGKWQQITNHQNAYFFPLLNNSLAMSKLADTKFEKADFANLMYSVPRYLKEFFTPVFAQ